ncbi:S41 family peptidase [Shewanella schlegeliana]|uniref:Tail specific protease domain-containing protein n=1 Tax=Shewanella schlegeliana TaxID=190308 RepID=A0ABS1SVY9_9GAMM|nr:S41 family peptidase [Shewanella schlegeliana]MBL4912683.1 hypothetical protein [Shewanella schlegeliana]MCL1109807.1 S41 family peptidase [Shewanella schlegeliana]GIU30214.1 hypothetical protein TUM4433_20410 [Shewanella schlegeliana]
MTLSYKGILGIFSLLICISAGLLSYQSFFPNQIKTELNVRQYQQDMKLVLDKLAQHSAFAANNPQRLHEITLEANSLIQRSIGIIQSAQLAQQLQRLLSQLDDPAVQVFAPRLNTPTAGKLPINLVFDQRYWQALNLRGKPVDAQYPYLSHIDGLPIAHWILASQRYLPSSLKQSRVAQANGIIQIARLRREIGLRHSNETIVTLTDGELSVQRALTLIQAKEAEPIESTQHRVDFRLPPQIDTETLQQLSLQLATQPESHSPSQLIIDIRAIKQPQDLLMAWLTKHFSDNKQQQKPLAVLQYKRFANARADRIASQYTPMSQLSFFEQTELKIRGFDNELKPSEAFSDYLVRRFQAFDTESITELGFIPKVDSNSEIALGLAKSAQLFLRVDSSCEQECEWIALATQHWPRVSLIGATTRGDLGPRYRITLPNSGVQVQFSSGLVYRPNGQLLSGAGLTPDIALNQLAFYKINAIELIGEKLLAQHPVPSVSP